MKTAIKIDTMRDVATTVNTANITPSSLSTTTATYNAHNTHSTSEQRYAKLLGAAFPHALEQVEIYSAPLIIPVTGPVIPHGAIAISRAKVVHVGERRWVLEALKRDMAPHARVTERHWRGVITPGIINAHTHLQYTSMAAVGRGHYASFEEWSRAFGEVYDAIEPQAASPWQQASDEGARMLIRYGTTAAADIVTNPEAALALANRQLHGITYWEVMDWQNSDWERAGIAQLLRQLGELNAWRVPSIGISPHAPYTLETKPFVDLPDIARQLNMRLHIHLAETPMEGAHGLPGAAPQSASATASTLSTYSTAPWRFRHWEHYQELKRSHPEASAIQFLDQLGSLGPDVHIAHGVWANAEDRRILRQRGVGVALCPRSNRITVTGTDAPLRAYLEEGNILAVGTDSLASSPNLDTLEDVAMLYDLAREQGYTRDDLSHRLIRMMTLGGAEVMGLHTGTGRIGQINAGATADLALFDIPVDVSTAHGIEQTLLDLVRYGAGANRATVIAGRLAYDNAFEGAS